MALLALEEAFTIGAKYVAPLLFESLFTSTVAGSSLASGRSNVPVQTNPGATPSNTDPGLADRLRTGGVDPGLVAGIANAPLIPPPPPAVGTSAPMRPTREYFETKNQEAGIRGLTAEQTDVLFNNELDAMAAFFNTSRESIGGIAELATIASNAVTGNGPVFTYWYGQRVARDMTYIMKAEQAIAELAAQSAPISRALAQARSDYEMKLGGQISPENFIRSLAARGVSAPRIERAWARVNGSRGDNASTRAVFRRWVTDRLLPGAAGSAVTFLLERMMGTGAPLESRNVSTKEPDDTKDDWDAARNDLLSRELRDVFASLDLGDEASGVIGSQSWNSRLSPLPGSVQWTPNPSLPTGLADSSPLSFQSPMDASPDITTYPGDTIYNRGLTGDILSERLDDNRAQSGPMSLNLTPPPAPTRTGLPPYLIVPDKTWQPGSMKVSHNHVMRLHFPNIHDVARDSDHLVSQTYDSSMVANLPSFVTPVTSSAGNLYGRDQQAYRNPLDSAPNITGAGFDVWDTERRLVEDVTMVDNSTSSSPPAAYFREDQQSMAERTKETPYVPPASQRDPVFANVGAQRPVAPIQPLPTARPL